MWHDSQESAACRSIETTSAGLIPELALCAVTNDILFSDVHEFVVWGVPRKVKGNEGIQYDISHGFKVYVSVFLSRK